MQLRHIYCCFPREVSSFGVPNYQKWPSARCSRGLWGDTIVSCRLKKKRKKSGIILSQDCSVSNWELTSTGNFPHFLLWIPLMNRPSKNKWTWWWKLEQKPQRDRGDPVQYWYWVWYFPSMSPTERSPQELPATELAANCRRDFLNGGFRRDGTAVFLWLQPGS